MKRIYNLAAALFFTTAVFGQWVYDPSTVYQPDPFTSVDIKAEYQKALERKKSQEKVRNKDGFDFVRVSHADERLNNYLGNTNGFVVPLMPDSVAQQLFDASGQRGAQRHAIGAIFDPTSEDFEFTGRAIADRDTYRVDTIWIAFNYRVVNPAVTDTFIVHVMIADSSQNSPAYGELYLVQTAPFPGAPVRSIRFTSNGNDGVQAFPAVTDTVIKRVMTLADTSSGVQYMGIPVGGMEVLPGNLFGFYGYYKPGGPWTSADIFWDQNVTQQTMNGFISYIFAEDDNANAFFAYDPSSYGSTHTLFQAGRYQVGDPSFLNDQIGPRLTSTLLVDFTYSTGNSSIGIEDYNSNAVLGTAYPNPFNDFTNIEYSLQKTTSVQLEVTDITGKVVLRQNEGVKSAGKYKIQLNAEEFNTGIYYYTLITETGRISKKMIVVE